jgi:hypothetical protein
LGSKIIFEAEPDPEIIFDVDLSTAIFVYIFSLVKTTYEWCDLDFKTLGCEKAAPSQLQPTGAPPPPSEAFSTMFSKWTLK